MSTVCGICGKPADPADPDTYHRVQGWERPSHVRASGKHGGSDLALRERVPGGGIAHGACVRLAKLGVNPGQEAML